MYDRQSLVTTISWPSRSQFIATFLAIVSVCLHMVVASAAGLHEAAVRDDDVAGEMIAMGSGTVVICGVHGSVHVGLGSEGSSQRPLNSTHSCDICQSCGSIDLPYASALVPGASIDAKAVQVAVAATRTWKSVGIDTGYSCRAPPV